MPGSDTDIYGNGNVIPPHMQYPVHVPLPYSINPLTTGIQIGLAGAATGLGYAAIQRAIRMRAGDRSQVSVAKPVLIGSLIGSALGAIAGWKYGDQTMPNPYPQTWEGVDQSIQDRVAAWPKFAGLLRLTEKRAQQVFDQSQYDKMSLPGQVLTSMIPIYGAKYDINQVGSDIGNMRTSWKMNRPGEAALWGTTALANTILGVLGQIPLAGAAVKGGKALLQGGRALSRASRAARVAHPIASRAGQATSLAMRGVGKPIELYGRTFQGMGNQMSRALPKALDPKLHPWRHGLATGGALTAGYAGTAAMSPHQRGYEDIYERSMQDQIAAAQKPASPVAAGGQTANTPRYDYGTSSGNVQPAGYGFMEKNQNAKYAGLRHIVEKRAQENPSVGSMLLNAGMYMLPGVGTGLAAKDTMMGVSDIMERIRAGQYGRAALSGLGTLGNAAITALTLAPGGGILARIARGMRLRKAAPGISTSIGHEIGSRLGPTPRRVLSKLLGTTGHVMRTKSPPKSWNPYLTWGGIPASVVGGVGPGLIDMSEAHRAPSIPQPTPTILARLADMFGSTEKPRIDYDVNPSFPTASSPLFRMARGMGA